MQHVRSRRVLAAAALTVCAGLALTGCRSQPGVAAYVGNETLTEAQVDAVVDNATSLVPQSEGSHAPTRSEVVETFVLTQTCERLRAEQGFALTAVSAAEVAQAQQVPAGSTYAQDRARMYSCLGGVKFPDQTKPTEAEARDIYDRALKGGLNVGDWSEARDLIINDAQLAQTVPVARELTKMVAAGDVTVNPRYRPMEFVLDDLSSGVGLVVVPLGEPGSDAVRDL